MNEDAHKKFKTFLKEGKFRITPERFEVMDYALEFEGHFGADELFIKMKSHNSSISRATVYNTLELLSECSLLSKRHFGDKIKRFESNLNRKSHDHIICENCGKIKEFTNPKIAEIIKEVGKQFGMTITNYSFNIYGKCDNDDECKAKQN